MKFLSTLLLTLLLLFPVILFGQNEDDPPNGMNELEAYSVFVDAVRSEDYEMAINFGSWIVEATPREIEGYANFELERQFDRMIDVYTGAAEKEDDPSVQTEYLEKAAVVFKKHGETFSDDEINNYEWELKEGRFYQEHHSNMDETTMDDAIEHYSNAYEADPERFTKEAKGYYAEVLLREMSDEEGRDRTFEMMEKMTPYAAEELQNSMNDIRESLFENPEERIEFYESQLAGADESEKEELLSNLRDLYEEIGNGEEAQEAARELYELNSSFENTRAVADIYLSDAEYGTALNYLLEALEMAEESDTRHDLMLDIARAYQQEESFEEAREYARNAIEVNENSGEAYLRIASVYTNTISSCVDGSKLEREDRVVYWLVLDYLEKAQEVDSSVASEAQNRAESYQSAIPSDEDKFFSEWETGDDFRIDGDLKSCYAWINETTTVR